MIKAWWKKLLEKRKARKEEIAAAERWREREVAAANLDAAIKLCQSHGLICCEIANKAGTDYIKATDGSWHRIGGKK